MIVKRCQKHGNLTEAQCYRDHHHLKLRCIECRNTYRNNKGNKPKTEKEKYIAAEHAVPESKYHVFMEVFSKLVKDTAPHYQLHKRFKNENKG